MSETEMENLEAIRARHAAATKGPWSWFGYLKNCDVGLYGVRMSSVMEFRRWGMRGAQPVFCTDGILRDLKEVATPDTSRERGRVTDINHPDARFIAASWADVRDLLAMVDALKAELGAKAQAYDDALVAAGRGGLKQSDLQFRVLEMEKALAAFTECPYSIDEATVSKAGIDAAPEQVVGTMSVSLAKVRNARALLGLAPDGRGGWKRKP